jgi:hypothetical protein
MIRDLQQFGALRVIERPDQFDSFLDPMDHGIRLLAIGAVLHVNARLAEPDHDLFERPLFTRSVEMNRHRTAASQGHEQQLVRPGPSIVPTGGARFVGMQHMPSIEHHLLENADPSRCHNHGIRLDLFGQLMLVMP